MPLREFAKLKNWDVVEEYVDRGWSGTKERRPQLDRLMLDARRGRLEAVMVWRFDRFARSTRHLITALEEFQKLQIDFVSLCEAIDTSTPVGKMVFTILGAVAEMERENIRERVRAGVERAKKQGVKLGRPTVLVDRALVRDRILRGDSVSSVSRTTGIARSTVRAIAYGDKAK